MQLLKSKILLIGKSERDCKRVLDVVVKPWIELVFVSNVESAMKATMTTPFDLVLCFYELDDTDGFHMYTLLNQDILQNEVPFIIVFKTYSKNHLVIGIELGIDSFILPCFNSERIANVIMLQLKKYADRKSHENLKYDAVFKAVPYGVFIAENNALVDANNRFYSLIKHQHFAKAEYSFNDIFTFNYESDELKLFRMINGLEKRTLFKNVRIKECGDRQFSLDLSFVKKIGSKNRIIGVVIPAEVGEENNELDKEQGVEEYRPSGDLAPMMDVNEITKREKQVLQLSAKGITVKQIAHLLSISVRTVEKHRSNIIRKTKTENIVEAVFKYSKYMQDEDAG